MYVYRTDLCIEQQGMTLHMSYYYCSNEDKYHKGTSICSVTDTSNMSQSKNYDIWGNFTKIALPCHFKR